MSSNVSAKNSRLQTQRYGWTSVARIAFALGSLVVPAMSQSVRFWPANQSPVIKQVPDDPAGVTLGLQFRSDVAGYVTAVRFYKGTNNTGTHVGDLWSSNGAKLAEVVFNGETAAGWQQANFSSPVHISANQNYVVSYFAPNGNYADDASYSWPSLSVAPLHISDSAPGVFVYGNNAGFPTGTWNGSNYWVDISFMPDRPIAAPVTALAITGRITGTAATLTLSGKSSATTKTDGQGNYSFSSLTQGTYVIAPSQPGYSFSPATASVVLNKTPASGVNFAGAPIPVVVTHSVTLDWGASSSPNISGYRVYRGTTSGGPYSLLNTSLLPGTMYQDYAVAAGGTYYYVSTAIDNSNAESGYSNEVGAVVPAH